MTNASNRFFGEVGYAITETDNYGVSTETIVKREYYGDVQKLNSKWQGTEYLNDDITVTHRISILADPYAIQNFPYIRYVVWMGVRWSVTSIEVQYPRILLSLGGVYNGPED